MTGIIGLTQGLYQLHFIARDNADNETPLELNNLKVDQTPPQLTSARLELILSKGRYLSGGTISGSWAAADNLFGVKGLRYWIVENRGAESGEGKLIASNLIGLTLPGETGKEYYLAIAAEDQAGNRSPVTYLGPILLDRTPPQVSLTLTGLKACGSSLYTFDLANLNLETTATDPETGITKQEITIVTANTGQPVASSGDWSVLKSAALLPGEKYRISFRAVNGVELESQTFSEEFTFDNTAPQNLILTGPTATLSSGEQAIFTVNASEPESAIVEYHLAIVSSASGEKITTLVPGNQNGWIILNSNTSPAEFRVELPTVPDETYYPVVEVLNAAGLKNATSGKEFSINNHQEKVVVGDQGPYTMFADRLTGWWKYTGIKAISGYQYRILNQDNQVVLDCQPTTETMLTVPGLQLESGKQYRVEVQANFNDGSNSDSGFSPGVTVDTSQAEITKLETPVDTTSGELTVHWAGKDDQSNISRVLVALGSDYYKTDITEGWVDILANSARLTRKANGNSLKLETGRRYYLTLRLINGAGLVSEKAAPGIMIDDTPPPVPIVTDQGVVINTSPYQPLEANWIWSLTDPESGIVKYQWAILEFGQDIATATWHDGDPSQKVSQTIDQFPRQHGKTYYFAVKAINGAGLSSIGYSDGILVDATAPFIPRVILFDAINLGNPLAPEVNYITSNQRLGLWIDSLDPDELIFGEHIDEYRYAWGKPLEVDQMIRLIATKAFFTLNNPRINEGEITVFLGECRNLAQLLSPTGYSTGVVLDTGAPKLINLRSGVSGNTLLFDWEVIPSVSPVAYYKINLVRESELNSPPDTWINVGLNSSYVMDGEGKEDGNYRLLVVGYNQAGTPSRRQGDIDEWGVSPRITIDREPPALTKFSYDSYAADQLNVQVEAKDKTSGIGGYQYALGSKSNPLQYSGGWVDLEERAGWIQFNIATANIPHNTEVYLTVRAKDNVGLWSVAQVSNRIIIDHTSPTIPEITCGSYTTNRNQISGISYKSNDPESGLTHYRLGVVPSKGASWLYTDEAPINEFNRILSNLSLIEAEAYYLAMQTRNATGVWSDVGYSQLITVDTIPPELVFPKRDSTIVLNHPPLDIEYTLSEPAEVQFTLIFANGSFKQYTYTGKSGLNVFAFNEDQPQTYQLTAKSVDPAGNVGDEKSQKIRVNAPPRIHLPSEFYTRPGYPLELMAAVVDPDGQSGQSLVYRWDPGDGGTAVFGPAPTYRYTKLGDYTLTLTVTDNDGGVKVATAKVKVENTVRGSLWMDETWSGTQHIYGDVTVPAGVTLTILPGTAIIAEDNSSLIVQGSLKIQGGRFSAASGATGGWNGIYLEGTANIDQVTIEDAIRGISAVGSASITISNSILKLNQVGLHVYGTRPEVRNCSFQENSLYGIKEDEGGRPLVISCSFFGNGMDYYHETLTEITMDELNQIEGNSGNHK
jgi:hypothetical protein